MNLGPRTTRTHSSGQVMQPGMRVPVRMYSLSARALRIVAVLESEKPDRWYAEVTVFAEMVLRTELFETETQAIPAAERAVQERLIRLLRD